MVEEFDKRNRHSGPKIVIAAIVCAVLAAVVVAGLATYRWIALRGSLASTPSSIGQPAIEQKTGATTDIPVEPRDYSASNIVTTLLGQENFDDGVKHNARERDGKTSIEVLEGVPCRYLNRKPENKTTGFLYFTIDATFKTRELKAATIEVEYLANSRTFLRLQYDAMEGENHRPYKSAMPEELRTVRLGSGQNFIPIQATGVWHTAVFRVADGAFQNSQNARSDFRIEVMPPEIYVRRVTVTREETAATAPQ